MGEEQKGTSRRDFLKKLGLGTAAIGFTSPLAMSCAADGKEPDFTFIHATDMHVSRKRKGVEGYQTFVNHINSLSPKPEFVLMGGDLAFDGLHTEKDEFEYQIDHFKKISDQLSMPYYPTLGNHDLLGWHPDRKVPISDPDLGKKFIMKKLGMSHSYYSFDAKGWHFVILDALHPITTKNGPEYEPRLGKEQLDWLRFDLGANEGKPTVIVCHFAAFNHIGQIESLPDIKAMNNMVLQDNKELRHILERHGVKLFLQGHTHISEDYTFNGVSYVTSQAVSAAWWGGNWTGFEPGYTICKTYGYDLEWEHKSFDWKHHLEPEDDYERKKNKEREEFLEKQQELLSEEQSANSIPIDHRSPLSTEFN